MCNKIIKKFAQENLEPLGFTQLKNSRTWFLNKSSYLIVVCFDSSGFSKGTYINVGINFLWNPKDYISFDFYLGKSNRITEFLEYQTDEQFTRELNNSSKIVLEVIHKYLAITDESELSNLITINNADVSNGDWLIFHKAVLEGLNENIENSKILFQKLISYDTQSDIPWNKNRLRESLELLACIKNSKESFASLVSKKVTATREILGI